MRWMSVRRGESNTLWIVIGAAVALVALVLLVFLLGNSGTSVARGTGCESFGGTCEFGSCPTGTQSSGHTCPERDQICCIESDFGQLA